MSVSLDSIPSKLPYPQREQVVCIYIPLTLRSPLTTLFQVFFGLPHLHCSGISVSLHLFTQQSFSIHSKCPYHLSIHFCIEFLIVSTPSQFLNPSDICLLFNVAQQSPQIILVWFLSNLTKSSSCTTQVSLPYRTTILMYVCLKHPMFGLQWEPLGEEYRQKFTELPPFTNDSCCNVSIVTSEILLPLCKVNKES